MNGEKFLEIGHFYIGKDDQGNATESMFKYCGVVDRADGNNEHEFKCVVFDSDDVYEHYDVSTTESEFQKWFFKQEPNSNCLSRMRCPDCGSLGEFKLTTKGPNPEQGAHMGQMELYKAVESGEVDIVEYMAIWSDDGSIDTAGDTEFVEDGEAECIACGLETTVSGLRLPE